jgi:hypothetical protein
LESRLVGKTTVPVAKLGFTVERLVSVVIIVVVTDLLKISCRHRKDKRKRHRISSLIRNDRRQPIIQ